METSVLLEWIGYGASLLIALSMALNSIVKFRVVNLVGAALFSMYGFLIGSIPVGVMNGFIVIVDLYYLVLFFSKKEIFETLEISGSNKYLQRFIRFHEDDIKKFYPEFNYIPTDETIEYFILRDMSVAGVLIVEKQGETTLKVILDYVTPQMRDFKNGRFAYLSLKDIFSKQGYTRLIADKTSPEHIKYLEKMGFMDNSDGFLEKALNR